MMAYGAQWIQNQDVHKALWKRARNFLFSLLPITSYRLALAIMTFGAVAPPMSSDPEVRHGNDTLFLADNGLRSLQVLAAQSLHKCTMSAEALPADLADTLRRLIDTFQWYALGLDSVLAVSNKRPTTTTYSSFDEIHNWPEGPERATIPDIQANAELDWPGMMSFNPRPSQAGLWSAVHTRTRETALQATAFAWSLQNEASGSSVIKSPTVVQEAGKTLQTLAGTVAYLYRFVAHLRQALQEGNASAAQHYLNWLKTPMLRFLASYAPTLLLPRRLLPPAVRYHHSTLLANTVLIAFSFLDTVHEMQELSMAEEMQIHRSFTEVDRMIISDNTLRLACYAAEILTEPVVDGARDSDGFESLRWKNPVSISPVASQVLNASHLSRAAQHACEMRDWQTAQQLVGMLRKALDALDFLRPRLIMFFTPQLEARLALITHHFHSMQMTLFEVLSDRIGEL